MCWDEHTCVCACVASLAGVYVVSVVCMFSICMLQPHGNETEMKRKQHGLARSVVRVPNGNFFYAYRMYIMHYKYTILQPMILFMCCGC